MAVDGLNIDLLHIIFSNLQKDVPTLISSATVCKLWRDVALPHMFALLVVRRRESFSDVVEFLDANPRIASYVRHLTLVGRRRSGRGKLPCLSPKTLIPIISRLPGLRGLSTGQLLQISSDPASDTERQQLSLPIPLLRLNILITGVDKIPFRALYNLLSLFDIGTLCLYGRMSNIEAIKDVPVDTVDVRKLILGYDHVASVARQCAVLEPVLSPATLTEISITIRFTNERIKRFCTFLGVVGQQLVKLDMNISSVAEAYSPDIAHILSDHYNEWTQQLPEAIATLLTIKLFSLRINHPQTGDFDNLYGVFFSTLASTTLERIVLELKGILAWHDPTIDKRLDWLELDGLSSRTRMPRLQSVTILLGGVEIESREEVVAFAQERFASLHASGLLRLEHK